MDANGPPLPFRRCLTKDEAADHIGIGLTPPRELEVLYARLRYRSMCDVVDPNAWLAEYKYCH